MLIRLMIRNNRSDSVIHFEDFIDGDTALVSASAAFLTTCSSIDLHRLSRTQIIGFLFLERYLLIDLCETIRLYLRQWHQFLTMLADFAHKTLGCYCL